MNNEFMIRIIADHIAGMTDRFAQLKYEQYTGKRTNLNITQI